MIYSQGSIIAGDPRRPIRRRDVFAFRGIVEWTNSGQVKTAEGLLSDRVGIRAASTAYSRFDESPPRRCGSDRAIREPALLPCAANRSLQRSTANAHLRAADGSWSGQLLRKVLRRIAPARPLQS